MNLFTKLTLLAVVLLVTTASAVAKTTFDTYNMQRASDEMNASAVAM